jgi:hypothetical protein
MAELVLSPIQRNRTLPQENIWSSRRVLPSITRLTQKLESPSDFTVTFTENKNGFPTVARLA